MTYLSSLTDREWEILEPLSPEVLPQKKKTRPLDWSYRVIIDGILYHLKNGCNWGNLPKELPPYSTVYRHYKQWRDAGTCHISAQSMLHQANAQEACSRSLEISNGFYIPPQEVGTDCPAIMCSPLGR